MFQGSLSGVVEILCQEEGNPSLQWDAFGREGLGTFKISPEIVAFLSGICTQPKGFQVPSSSNVVTQEVINQKP